MAYKISKSITFSYGHRLIEYDGKCKNLHGHNGKIEIVLESNILDKRGMVVDFSEVKNKIKKWIDKELDHRMLISSKDPWLAPLSQLDPTVVAVDFNPTAENLAKMIYQRIKDLGFPVSSVKLWETDTSCADYSGSTT